jgi:group I intron endonuclease
VPLVYLITNTLDGKRYVGRTYTTLANRWRAHLRCAETGETKMLVARAIGKHGHENFTCEVLEETGWDNAEEREKHWVKELRTHVSQGGYNLTFGGDGGLPGYTFSEESKDKIRQKAIGRKHSEATKTKMKAAAQKRVVTQETIDKRAAGNRGTKRTPEQKARMAAAQKEMWKRAKASGERQRPTKVMESLTPEQHSLRRAEGQRKRWAALRASKDAAKQESDE